MSLPNQEIKTKDVLEGFVFKFIGKWKLKTFNKSAKWQVLTRLVLDQFHDSSIPPISGFGFTSWSLNKIWGSVLGVERLVKKLRKCDKVCYKFQKCAKTCESMRKCAKVEKEYKSVPKLVKVWEKLRKNKKVC